MRAVPTTVEARSCREDLMRKAGQSVSVNLVICVLGVLCLLVPHGSALAQANLTNEPVTWNVIGLDSNNVNVGPNHFPIGAKVCNTSATTATNVKSSFVWDTTDPYIATRPGTNASYTADGINLAQNVCTYFYYEVEVTRNASAYGHAAQYHITAVADNAATVSTPTPRALFVEHLISQSRNAVNDMQLSTDGVSYSSIAPGGTMGLMVGQEYWIKLVGKTATNGYEQIESFINFPNTIFQILTVATTYTADTTPRYPPTDRLYTDGCLWETNPLSPNYRSCWETGKAGGDITVTYKIKILSMPASPLTNPEALTTLVYDYSGSSYHYNADFGATLRFVRVVNASIEKSFSPKSLNPNTTPAQTSTLTFTITNPGSTAITGVNFSDTLPTNGGAPQMSIASTTVTCSGFTVNPSPSSLSVGQTLLSFTGATVPALSSATIAVTVTVPQTGNPLDTYNNDSGNLFIGSIDTGDDAKDTLVATDLPAGPSSCGTRTTMAQWTMAANTPGPPPDPDTPLGDGVSSAAASGSGTQSYVTGRATYGWQIAGAWTVGIADPGATSAGPYFQLEVDSHAYGGAAISVNADLEGNPDWASATNNYLYVWSSTDGTTWVAAGGSPNTGIKKGSWTTTPATFTAAATGVSKTYFRLKFAGAADKKSPTAAIDDITIAGCPRPRLPKLSKTFSPTSICTNPTSSDYSTLTFTVKNTDTPGTATALTGVGFTDTLPTGLLIDSTSTNPPTVSCSPANSLTGATISAAPGATLISMSGGNLAASSTCTFPVRVRGTVTGAYTNVSGSITSTETSYNTSSGGYGTANLTAVAQPVIDKTFGTTNLITGQTTSLTFSITNPNSSTSLTGVGFTDTLPAGLDVPSTQTLSVCGGTNNLVLTDNGSDPSQDTIVLSNTTVAAGSPCQFSVTLTGNTTGPKTNSVLVTSTNGCTGNTAEAEVFVRDLTPKLSLRKQVSTSLTGPWYDSRIIPAGSTTVYYKFTVENTGDAALTSIGVTDPDIPSWAGCAWTALLPVAVTGNDNHITTCVRGPYLSVAGSKTNTARAQGTYSGTVYNSNYDSAVYQNGNFGHLPSAYLNMNMFNDGGAFHLNGDGTDDTYFGASYTWNATDGINTQTYTPKVTDDGVTWTPGLQWTTGANGGKVDVTVLCGSAQCYMNAWIDWNGDNDFNDAGEQIFTNRSVNDGKVSLTFDIPAGTSMDATYYSRFRVYPALPTNPQPNGQAYASGTPLEGEIEDPFFKLSGGIVTPVTLGQVVVERQGRLVRVDWTTELEAGTVGFKVIGVRGNEEVLLNEELVPGALDSLEPRRYSFETDAPGLQAVVIEEVDAVGHARRHGPFALDTATGAPQEAHPIDWPMIQREQTRLTREREGKLPPPQARARLLVDRDGIVRVSAEALAAAGFSFDGQKTDSLAVLNQGAAIPITVACIGGSPAGTVRFGPGCYVEFPGAALDTLYTKTNVYTLLVDKQQAQRIPVDPTLPAVSGAAAAYRETTTVEKELVYSFNSPNGDPWYETRVSAGKKPVSRDFVIPVDTLARNDTPSTLHLNLWGANSWPVSPNHHVVVALNGVTLADRLFTGIVEADFSLPVPGGVLKAGTNTLRVTLPGDTAATSDLIAVDRYGITFDRPFVAVQGELTFEQTAPVFEVRGLNGPVFAYRRLEGLPITRLVPQVKGSGPEQLVRVPGSRLSGVYSVADSTGLVSPRIVRDPGATITFAGKADLLIVAHPNFLAAVEKYAAYRNAAGIRTRLVDVQAVFDTYGGGIVGPQPIRTLIAQAAQRLGITAVLLVGGDTYDYFNYAGSGSISFIPTPYARTDALITFAPVDPQYGDLDGDQVPDIAVGRWPVRTLDELEAVIAKSMRFGDRTDAPWALLAADRVDGPYSFAEDSEQFSALVPETWGQTKAYADILGLADTRQLILTSLDAGPTFANWFGHSSYGLWSFDRLLTTADALVLRNTDRPFVVTQWGCWNTYHVLPTFTTLGHALMLAPDRGAAAVIGAATLTAAESDRMLSQLLIPELLTPGTSIGQAMTEAKRTLAASHPEMIDVILGTTLLGDPTLTLPAAARTEGK
jgi:uncharacterized repeat protein (TIGR01451 family)